MGTHGKNGRGKGRGNDVIVISGKFVQVTFQKSVCRDWRDRWISVLIRDPALMSLNSQWPLTPASENLRTSCGFFENSQSCALMHTGTDTNTQFKIN